MDLQTRFNRLYFEMSINELQLMNNNKLYPNITYNSLLYMDIIADTKNCTASYLANLLHVSKSAVTIKVNELIRQGLVIKAPSQEDKRINYLSVTPEIRSEYQKYDRNLARAAAVIEQTYSREQVVLFGEMLELFRKNYLEDFHNE